MTNDMTKKYILKPGKHQFAPGSPAVHSNDSINDAEAKWYLEKYPHVANLFIQIPKNAGDAKPRKKIHSKARQAPVRPGLRGSAQQ